MINHANQSNHSIVHKSVNSNAIQFDRVNIIRTQFKDNTEILHFIDMKRTETTA